MIAEIHNKISKTDSNLSDRLEDQLTGDFFGTIRYLPFDMALKQVLLGVQYQDFQAQVVWQTLLSQSYGNNTEFEFWPRYQEGCN
ncbi:hypothetical protein [Bacillus canaveralius]|uniref:hypothetical protein n=1 Tax=Bacillus canaveralius TaxID=1403243 RepID=UPI001C609A65|nr:hypothetical protein [Bacillus canaveralius]